MIYPLNFNAIFKIGLKYFLKDIQTIEQIQAIHGKPDDIENYNREKLFYHYDNLRFDFNESKLEQVVVYFFNYENYYPITPLNDDKSIRLDNGISICNLLYYLNSMALKWNINYSESNLDYVTIRTESGTKILFYLYDNKLDRIVVEKTI